MGCGNGKYLSVASPAIRTVGCDRSGRLLRLAAAAHAPAAGGLLAAADALALPWRTDAFDYALSIAVIHHMATAARRAAAVRELVRVVRPGGRILVFVWAQEQAPGARRRFEQQDVLVPWHLPVARYAAAGGKAPVTVPSAAAAADAGMAAGVAPTAHRRADGGTELVYQRFYHVFRAGELEALVHECVPDARIARSGFDAGNWFVELEVLDPEAAPRSAVERLVGTQGFQ